MKYLDGMTITVLCFVVVLMDTIPEYKWLIGGVIVCNLIKIWFEYLTGE